jgi:glycerate kinase
MNVLIAMDSFKGNLSSLKVAGVVEEGIRRVYPEAVVEKAAMADGGEGTVDTLVDYFQGEFVDLIVAGPLGNPVKARYGIVEKNTAIMEMAEASGLSLILASELNPLKTSTFGTGQMIIDALNRGCTKIIMGIGGSATNDGGQGMAAALGTRFLDEHGNEVGLGGMALLDIVDIDLSGLDKRLQSIKFTVACDVDNPLCGEYGASNVFGPQKGATPEMIELLDKGLASYAAVLNEKTGIDIKNIPGSGAAGGLGGGLMAFCHASLGAGIDIVMDTVGIENKIKAADIIITGEGRVDSQTVHGKVPAGIAGRAKKYGKPVFAIAGYAGKGANEVYQCGIDAVISSITAPMNNDEAMKKSVPMIMDAAERLFRTIRAVSAKRFS